MFDIDASRVCSILGCCERIIGPPHKQGHILNVSEHETGEVNEITIKKSLFVGFLPYDSYRKGLV